MRGSHEKITLLAGIGRRVRPLTVAAAVLVFSSTACGGGGDGSRRRAVSTGATTAITTTPPVTATATTPATPTAPVATTTTTTTTPTTTAPTGGATVPGPDGGASATPPPAPGGDEQGTRVPAVFQVRTGALTPHRISVPPFLRVELRVTSADGAAHRVVLRIPSPVTLQVPPRGRVTALVDGLARGDYALEVDGRAGGGTLHVADDAAGP